MGDTMTVTERRTEMVRESQTARWHAANLLDYAREGGWEGMSKHLLALKETVDRMVVTLGLEN